MSVEANAAADARPVPRKLQIDFLFLDLPSCTRCRGTERSLRDALTVVTGVLQAAGIEVNTSKVQVASEELARAWRVVSSPTIRISGTDIALERRQSSCGSEACTDGCGDRRFFAGKQAWTREAPSFPDIQPTEEGSTGCCPSNEQDSCCDTSAKADCCGAPDQHGCGCR